jgi:hypothetical protein
VDVITRQYNDAVTRVRGWERNVQGLTGSVRTIALGVKSRASEQAKGYRPANRRGWIRAIRDSEVLNTSAAQEVRD